MNIEHRDYSTPPPSLEEGYWKALLHEGEYAASFEHPNRTIPPRREPEKAKAHREEVPLHFDDPLVLQDWAAIETIMQRDQTVDLHVVGYNRGGLLVEWRNIRGFVPASQLMHFPTGGSPAQRQERLSKQVNNSLTLRVIELNQEQNRLVLSERAAQVKPGTRAQILDEVAAGENLEGVVTNITDFGVFVDLGGIEGLIHISELSWGRVGHPRDVLCRGEVVSVHVLDTNKAEGRIALSVKRLYPDPWRTARERYEVGQVIRGHITNIVDFGAFVRIEEGLEGLVHISELAEGHFLHPRNVVEDGQVVQARILSIDPANRRLGLSIRQVNELDD